MNLHAHQQPADANPGRTSTRRDADTISRHTGVGAEEFERLARMVSICCSGQDGSWVDLLNKERFSAAKEAQALSFYVEAVRMKRASHYACSGWNGDAWVTRLMFR